MERTPSNPPLPMGLLLATPLFQIEKYDVRGLITSRLRSSHVRLYLSLVRHPTYIE